MRSFDHVLFKRPMTDRTNLLITIVASPEQTYGPGALFRILDTTARYVNRRWRTADDLPVSLELVACIQRANGLYYFRFEKLSP